MNITSAKKQIKDAVEAYLALDDVGMPVISTAHQRPVFLVGAPGIGKTAIMEQIARELEIGIVSYSMTHHTRQSALGLPRIEHREFEGLEYEASEYTMSEIVAAVYDYMERTGLRRGILFLDEINCVSETLYPSMLQFLQFKTFGKHRIPEGWVVVCAGNPPEYNRSVHEFDIVTLDRMRQIDVDPDYGAWKAYATENGLHPAVTTFLETKRDCFYKVESKPGGGKAFVTARGWEDLARIVSLHESLGKPVNRDLVVQFLRDDEVADKFAVYYELFNKYRSDYQVDAILAGEVGISIKNRAQDAAFDERVALMSLILDSLARECSEVLDAEGVLKELRDVLRAAKPELLAGASAADALGSRIAERERALGRKMESGVAAASYVRRERLVIAKLKELAAACELAGELSGEGAFRVIEAAYKKDVAGLQPAAREAGNKMNAAFDFVSECFGSREMLVFVAEVATRQATTQFIARYGNDRYYLHSKDLRVDAARMGLAERASLLEDLDGRVGQAAAEGAGADAPAAALAAFYASRQFEYGFSSVCKMTLPVDRLKGKRVLDLCCRRGKGVYKLSSMVGEEGSVLGIDWNEAYIAEARDGAEHARRKNRLTRSNMEFRAAYPEDLISAGVGSSCMDVAYVNNVVNLFADPAQALRELGRVLKPGGLLVLETVYADVPRDPAVVEAAREMGNSIQAARTLRENLEWLRQAGFDEPEVMEEYGVAADRGFEAGSSVDVAPSAENVRFTAACLYVRRR